MTIIFTTQSDKGDVIVGNEEDEAKQRKKDKEERRKQRIATHDRKDDFSGYEDRKVFLNGVWMFVGRKVKVVMGSGNVTKGKVSSIKVNGREFSKTSFQVRRANDNQTVCFDVSGISKILDGEGITPQDTLQVTPQEKEEPQTEQEYAPPDEKTESRIREIVYEEIITKDTLLNFLENEIKEKIFNVRDLHDLEEVVKAIKRFSVQELNTFKLPQKVYDENLIMLKNFGITVWMDMLNNNEVTEFSMRMKKIQ